MTDSFLKKLNEAEKRDTIKKSLKIKKLIGKGSSAQVLQGKYSKRDVAVKIFKRYNRNAIIQYQNELAIFKLLLKDDSEKFIVSLFATLSTPRNVRLIMELGKMTLRNKMTLLFKKFNIYDITNIIEQIIIAIRFMHNLKIAHRDLKPENILIFENNSIKICDFGFAKSAEQPLKTICGTIPYMAPELMIQSSAYYGMPVDVWALGVIIFELLHNRLPFQGYNILGFKRNIIMAKYHIRPLPEVHKKLIISCLTKKINNRSNIFDLIIPKRKISKNSN
tara:strand:- start:1365 stop:2198 length:834 start_codon:yes stop_codon:yes gene_type:complete